MNAIPTSLQSTRLRPVVAVGAALTFVILAAVTTEAQDRPRPTRLPLVESDALQLGSFQTLDRHQASTLAFAEATGMPSLAGTSLASPGYSARQPSQANRSDPTGYQTGYQAAPGQRINARSQGNRLDQPGPGYQTGPADQTAPLYQTGPEYQVASKRPSEAKKAQPDQPASYSPNINIDDFSATPMPQASMYHDPIAAQFIYDDKHAVPTQRPLIELGRMFYADGITPRGLDWFGPMNMVRPQFYVYGDFRSGIIAGRNAAGRTDNWSSRLNLDMDLRVTDTERFHGFIGPLNKATNVNGVQLVDDELDFNSVFNPNLVTAFFEGDLGAMWGGFHNKSSPAEIPFTIGLVPLLFQNGIWMEDAVTGAAFALPARHSRLLNWSNYETTFFAVVDQLNSNAFAGDNHAAQAFGNAWFIEAYGGYIEAGYAYVRDRNNSEKSYHNVTASFTRRYFDRISNSTRVILNTGQDLDEDDRTADGGLLLWENSWITAAPLTVVPYVNAFYGWGRPQSVARAAASGGILRNTGINFDTDGVNGLATLDTNGFDTAGGSIGVDLIGNDLSRQLILEASYQTEHGDSNPFVNGDQFGLGGRYQFPISNSQILRFDVMHGWRGNLDDVYGTRMEYRWKF
ncbi:hypothetical protein SAMN06265222_101245 [Neorhodopirellula lusitana]|uniref:Uncharacterized protein n=1 Tax=Neorhodopirellula lusitana TaxID=445327 RepID=A0ABY1PNY3_9BACT|nr:hypothetical protein [Neorhodopirellula lusitana]SMP39075.1 hypothetical protein SAMN06265222_101245 [Neorhodopirellula lusitana]